MWHQQPPGPSAHLAAQAGDGEVVVLVGQEVLVGWGAAAPQVAKAFDAA